MNDETYATARGLLKQGAVADVRGLLAPIESERETDSRLSHLFGVCDFRESNFEDAETHFRKAVSLDGLAAESRYYIGLCLERRGRTKEAQIEYTAVLAIKTNHAGAIKKLGKELPAPRPTKAAAAGKAIPPESVVKARSDESKREEDGVEKGIYTDHKPKFVYYIQIAFTFIFTLALVGGIAGFIAGAVTSGNVMISLIAGLLVGTIAGIANAGTIKRFK